MSYAEDTRSLTQSWNLDLLGTTTVILEGVDKGMASSSGLTVL